MPSLTVTIQAQGPVVQVAITVSEPRRQALLAAGLPVPAPTLVTGLIDTGASGTCIDPSIIAALKISPSGVVPIRTPSAAGNPIVCQQYDVGLAIYLGPNQLHAIQNLPVVEAHLGSGIQMLIGRDVLKHGILFYNGPAGTTTICF